VELRRSLLAALAALIVFACATAHQAPTCATAETLCEYCTNLQTDPDNCGKCGTSCPLAQVCVAGACKDDCPSGNAVCTPDGSARGYCVDVKNDNANCGKCGVVCTSSQTCVNGTCSTSCATGSNLCTPDGGGATFCANLKTDNQNCGACGKPCGAGELCSNGACVGSCTSSQMKCTPDAGSPYCTDTQTDNANCGACGTVCKALEVCSAGVCTSNCLQTQTKCGLDGGTPFCADTFSDNTNCGTCGNVCPSNKPICQGGVCSDGKCNKTALVLGDAVTASNSAYQTLLQGAGFTVTVVASGTTTYANSPAANGFGVIIVTPGNTYGTDMPSAGQTAIVNAVGASTGTGVIFTEWAAYNDTVGVYTTLFPLLCYTRSSGTTSTLTFTLTQTGHPIWNGLPTTFTTTTSLGANISGTLQTGAIQIASCTQCGTYGVAVRDPSSTGRVVQIAHAAGYLSETWYNETNLTKMMSNAALWAARCL